MNAEDVKIGDFITTEKILVDWHKGDKEKFVVTFVIVGKYRDGVKVMNHFRDIGNFIMLMSNFELKDKCRKATPTEEKRLRKDLEDGIGMLKEKISEIEKILQSGKTKKSKRKTRNDRRRT